MRSIFRIMLILIAALVCLQTACNNEAGVHPPWAQVSIAEAYVEPQGFIELWGSSLPNTNVDVNYARLYFEPMDEDSVEMFEVNGTLYYSPVHLCHRCYHFMGAYLKTGEWQFIERAETYAARLMELSVVIDEARWVRHQYPFRVHGRADLELPTPFFSGMAQGEMLSVLVRLYEFTGKQEYLEAARQVFASLVLFRSDSSPWVARLDSAGYYWLEEFPHDSQPGMTLNGYIAGIYGVYDYYRVTDDTTARRVWDAALTTLKHYIPAYRRPGQYSYYCLGHHHKATDGYHRLHIRMMDHLLRLTGDRFFREWSDIYRSDLPPNPVHSSEDPDLLRTAAAIPVSSRADATLPHP